MCRAEHFKFWRRAEPHPCRGQSFPPALLCLVWTPSASTSLSFVPPCIFQKRGSALISDKSIYLASTISQNGISSPRVVFLAIFLQRPSQLSKTYAVTRCYTPSIDCALALPAYTQGTTPAQERSNMTDGRARIATLSGLQKFHI